MTVHTIIAALAVWLPFEIQNKSIAGWLSDAVDGKMQDYSVKLIEKNMINYPVYCRLAGKQLL